MTSKTARIRSAIAGALLLHALAPAMAVLAAPPDTAAFLAQRGARDDGSAKVRSPTPDIAPLVYTDKDAYAPSCALLVARPGAARPAFVELTGPDGREGFPYCMGILSITPFGLLDRQYVAVEYLARETREDLYRQFAYLVRDGAKGYVVDDTLHGGGEADGVLVGALSNAALGVRQARIAALQKAFPHGQLQERDFVSDKASSFAVFVDRKAQRCSVVAEAGGKPFAAALADIVPGARCDDVLAATRLAQSGTTYYLALFKSADKRLVTVTSVSADGRIASERRLADTLNRSGATRDIKAARTALGAALR